MTPRPARASGAPSLVSAAAMGAGLWGLGAVQPLLDLLGRNPAFFVAADAGPTSIFVFVLLIAVAVPVLLTAALAVLQRFAPRAYPYVVAALIVGGAALVGLALGRNLFPSRTLGHLVVVLAVTGGISFGAWRSEGFRSFLQTLALTLPVFVGLFLFTTESGDLLRSADVGAADGVTVGRPDDVVMVVLDELPLSTLLDADGELDSSRYPGFTALADESTFYVNTVADHSRTSDSVPTIASGVVPEMTVAPIAAEYPHNLFTLLGTSHEMTVREDLTQLCPDDLCEIDRPSTRAAVQSLVDDSVVVLQHLLLPPRLREGLPAIDQGWGDFDQAASIALGGSAGAGDPLLEWQDQQANEVSRTAERTRLIESVVAAASEPADPRPELFFVHSVLPHAPWERSPDGTLLTRSADHDLPLDETGRWTTSEPDVIHAFQRHALQVGHVDRMIGDLVTGMQQAGRWDDTVVVVTADHGTSFTPGTSRRVGEEASLDEVYRVPLFIHAPDQDAGATDDRLTRLADIVPTIMDLLEVSVEDWELDGISLVGDGDLPQRVEVRSGNETLTVAPTNEGALAAAARNAAWFPHGTGWRGLAAPGAAGALVGSEVDGLELEADAGIATTDVDASVVDRSTGYAPLLIPIAVEPAGEMPQRVLVAVDGIIAGVGLPVQDEPGLFRAILDPGLLPDGAHTLRVFAWNDDGVGELTLQAGSRLERTPEGWMVAGQVLTEEPSSATRLGFVEQVSTDGPVMAVSGWAADLDRRQSPQFVALVDGDTVLSVDTALTTRSDVANEHGEDVAQAAFSMRGPASDGAEVVVVFEDSTLTLPADEPLDP